MDIVERLRQQLAECERERDQWKFLMQEMEETARTYLAGRTEARQQLATVTKERDEYNTARLALIAKCDEMWDARDRAEKERDRLEASQRSAWNAAVLKDEQLTTCQQQRDELVAALELIADQESWDASGMWKSSSYPDEIAIAALAKVGAIKTGEGS